MLLSGRRSGLVILTHIGYMQRAPATSANHFGSSQYGCKIFDKLNNCKIKNLQNISSFLFLLACPSPLAILSIYRHMHVCMYVYNSLKYFNENL